MKVTGGRTIYHNKKGDLIYDSKAKTCHLVAINKLASDKLDTRKPRLLGVKLEERFKGKAKVPAKTIADLASLGDFKPFSFKNGLAKYCCYSFNKEKLATLRPKSKKKVKKLLVRASYVGMTQSFKEANDKSRNLAKVLKKFEVAPSDWLDKLWQKSFEKFMS